MNVGVIYELYDGIQTDHIGARYRKAHTQN
jgi:hypothetical protein